MSDEDEREYRELAQGDLHDATSSMGVQLLLAELDATRAALAEAERERDEAREQSASWARGSVVMNEALAAAQARVAELTTKAGRLSLWAEEHGHECKKVTIGCPVCDFDLALLAQQPEQAALNRALDAETEACAKLADAAEQTHASHAFVADAIRARVLNRSGEAQS